MRPLKGWLLGSVVAALGACAVTTSARAESASEPFVGEPLRIELDAKASRKPPQEKKAKAQYFQHWKTACTRLGKTLSAHGGPWGFGIFSGFSCHRGKTLVAGKTAKTPWALTFVDGAKTVSINLKRDGKTISSVTLPPSDATLAFFLDDEFVDLLGFSLLDPLPAAMVVTPAMVKGSPPKFSGRYPKAGRSRDFKYDVPEAPETLVIYRLAQNSASGLWESQVVGTAKRVKVVEPTTRLRNKNKVKVGGEAVYETTDAVATALATGELWAHDASGPGAHHPELTRMVNEAHAALLEAAKDGRLPEFIKSRGARLLASLLDSAASGYVGIRYGLQVLPADGELGKLLAQTSIFSLLAEVRGGPVKGLRYYYDKQPEAKATLDNADGTELDARVAFSRHTLGYSFGFDPGVLVDRITVAPKIGMWSFEAKLPTEQDADGKVTRSDEFTLGRTFSVAAEFGLEMLSDWYTLRTWYGIDTGFSLLKTGGRVTSNRLGIDAFFTAGPTFPIFGVPFKTALLAFYVYEAVTLTPGEVEDPEPGEDKISGIDYSTGYAGGGVAISW